jgi:D-sedoheptulose 7-phosphate isomerase
MKNSTFKQITGIIETHKQMIAALQADGIETIAAAARLITKSIRRNGAVYICGNGGSAADAQHIAGELVGKFECKRRALPALALTTDTSVITSIANDVAYETVFERQVEAMVKKGDVLWAISTSGASPNVLAAVKLAKKRGARVLALTGRKNTPLEKLADICLAADSSSTARSQEIHQLAYHIICKLVEQNFTEP